jgi:hypothetical protein
MDIKCALHPRNKHKTPETKPTSMAKIPYMRISRLLAKYNIKTICWPEQPVKVGERQFGV